MGYERSTALGEELRVIAGRDDLVVVESNRESDPDSWFRERMRGIGGSDAAAVLGEDPNKAAIDVWLERTTGPDPMLDNERTAAGRWLEPLVLDAFARGGDNWPRPGGPMAYVKPPTVRHRDRLWQFGSADALLYEDHGIGAGGECESYAGRDETLALTPSALGEVKTHGWLASRAYDMSEDGDPIVSVPGAKRIQCAWYQALYQVEVCYLIALVDTHLRRTFVLQRDPDLEATMLEEIERFWTKCVVAGVPPEPDGTGRYGKYLKERFKRHDAEILESTPEVELATESLLSIKREQKILQRQRDRAEQIIKAHIGDMGGVRTTLGSLTWSLQSPGKLKQAQALAELYKTVGWSDSQVAEFESRHQQPDHRVLRTPR